jgi:hypothetical protein
MKRPSTFLRRLFVLAEPRREPKAVDEFLANGLLELLPSDRRCHYSHPRRIGSDAIWPTDRIRTPSHKN